MGLRLRIFLLVVVAAPLVAHADDDHDFRTLIEEAWEWRLENDPVFASTLGDRRYNDRWADSSLAGIDARHADVREFLRRLYAIDRAKLGAIDQLNYELFRRELQNNVDAHRYRGFLLPFSHRGGVQTLHTTTNYLRFANARDYGDWLTRLDDLKIVIGQSIERAERGRRSGYLPPCIIMQRIPDQLAAQLVENPADSPFFEIFATLPNTIAEAERERLRAVAIESIERQVLPAYRRLHDYFVDTYLPSCRASIGLSALPDGAAWYEQRARVYTTTSMTPEEIHRVGLDEVRRIRDAMQAVIGEVGFDGTFREFLDHLRTNPDFYFTDADDLHTAYLATAKRIDPELVRLFGRLPRVPYGVKPIPAEIAPDTTTAYYTRPAADGSRAGIFWVNLYRPEVRPKYEIEVLTVHEAMPGHHLQIALQQELADLPDFRRYLGFTAFVEGWGLYSESLGYDLGLYTDPYSRFGQLTYEMWRAIRLVVDTGIHYKGWTRQQAIDFFKDNAAKTEHDIVNEIDRYIGNPGQALAYKIGQMKIQALRDNARQTLGEEFDIREFHDAILAGGALPLDMLEQRMDLWLIDRLESAAR